MPQTGSVGAWKIGKFEWGEEVRKDSSIHPQPSEAVCEDGKKKKNLPYTDTFYF